MSPGRDPAPGGPSGSQADRGSEERLRGPEEPGVRQGHRQQQGGAEELRRRAGAAAPPQENNRQRSSRAGHWYVKSGLIKGCTTEKACVCTLASKYTVIDRRHVRYFSF